jgi:hypothetical protein
MAALSGQCFIRDGEFIRMGDGTRSSSELSDQDRYALGLYYEITQEPKLNHDARRKLRLERKVKYDY